MVEEDRILSILAFRRARERSFGRELFADPAWDLLLELYAARLGARSVTIEDLARSIDVPCSVARRWIHALGQRGLAIQSGGGEERFELSPDGASTMKRLMDSWGAAFRSI
jgi:hypothetical protein